MVTSIKNEEDFAALVDSEGDEVDRLMQKSVREALRRHKRLGQPIVVWKDGKTVWLKPEEIDVPDEEEEPLECIPVGNAPTNGATPH